MKALKYSLMGLVVATVGLSSCQNSYDAPGLEEPKATLVPNTKLIEIKEMIQAEYDGENDVVLPIGEKADGSHYIVHGRVISSDASGNIYQNLVLQDETAALTLSIREASMWTSYRVGQDVVLDLTGLYMGTYSGLFQIGWPSEYYGDPSMTFMSWFMFKEHNQLNGFPNQNFEYIPIGDGSDWPSANPYCFITTIKALSEISATTTLGIKVMSQLVEIQDVYFENGGKDTYAEYQESNERRYVVDASGNKIALNNSGYATFHNDILPVGMGSVRGILGYYQDKWQITIRDLDDVMFDGSGNKAKPYTVAEAIEQGNNGRTGWTKGYIVGTARPGVNTITSSDDICFGTADATPNNLIIADSKDETDWTKCMAVQLPPEGMFRQFVNLVDNPEMLGQKLNVRGTFASYLGMHGIIDNGGALSDFAVDGMDFTEGLGSGDEDYPYTVKFVLQNPNPQNSVWVEGYIVGYVNGANFQTGATFNADVAGMTDYNNANVIIADSPDGANITNSIPVRTLDRTAQGLKAHPENLGKKIKVQGNLGGYLQSFGVSDILKWEFE